MTLQGNVIPEPSGIRFLEVTDASLEYVDLPGDPHTFPILLLHEGLGSVSMWRDFPAQLAEATGARVVAYSRAGFGRSSPRKAQYTPHFIQEEAVAVIPELRDRLGLRNPVLVGHSTGASMALAHAAGHWPVAGVVAMAPLTDVEGSNLESIRRARMLYETTDWRARLARHHDDVDAVFYGWNDTWLRPEFRAWNIVAELKRVRAPVLAILGASDEYSTASQLDAIARNVPDPSLFQPMVLAGCGHAPHRDQPAVVLAAIKGFVGAV